LNNTELIKKYEKFYADERKQKLLLLKCDLCGIDSFNKKNFFSKDDGKYDRNKDSFENKIGEYYLNHLEKDENHRDTLNELLEENFDDC